MKFEELKWCMNSEDDCTMGRFTNGTNSTCVI